MANKTILFTVRRQHLHSKQVMVYFPSNIVNYIAAEFDMDEEWNECDVIKAVWYTERAQIATVLESGSCIVPQEVLVEKAKVYVNLVGSVVENGEIIERITSYPYLAIIVDKNAKIDGSETVPVTPSQFEQFVDAVKSETSKVTGMTATAETLPSGSEATASYSDGVLSLGIPMGAQGEKGDTGERGMQGIQGERGERGEQGLQGAQGERGERGETGATGAKGDTGNGISSITKTGSSGLVDTYTITFTDGTSTTFNVTNGKDGSGADIDVDSELSTTSTNPVQNKVIATALDSKANTSSLASVATSGNYNDLSNKPTIPTVPTNVSAFINDAGYLTSYTETDPVFSASPASGITSEDIAKWNTVETLCVTVTKSGDTYVADKTFAEVTSAIDAGKFVYCQYSTSTMLINFVLISKNANRVIFVEVNLTVATANATVKPNSIFLHSDDTVEYSTAVGLLTTKYIVTAVNSSSSNTFIPSAKAVYDFVTSTDTDTTYTLSISGNVITLTPSSGTASSITLPVSETEWGDITGTLANQTDLQSALNAKASVWTVQNMTASDTVVTLNPNVFYIFPEMATLTVTVSGTGMHAFRFTSGTTATTLTVNGATMPDSFEVESGKVYEVNVYQGYGVVSEWTA